MRRYLARLAGVGDAGAARQKEASGEQLEHPPVGLKLHELT
jgi:hypothetical protein